MADNQQSPGMVGTIEVIGETGYAAPPGCRQTPEAIEPASVGLGQFIQQHLCFFQVGRIEAFGKPVVERG